MNINDIKNSTKEIDLERTNKVYEQNNLIDNNLYELKEKIDEYLKNNVNELEQWTKNKFNVKNRNEGKSNNEIKNSAFETRTPLGKVIIEEAVAKTLSDIGIKKLKNTLEKTKNNRSYKGKLK